MQRAKTKKQKYFGFRLQASGFRPLACSLKHAACSILFLSLFWNFTFAQDSDLEFTLDINSETTALPKIFKPNIDLGGRGSHRQVSWPQTMAAPEALGTWQKDIGFSGIYRLQYNFWEINQLAKDKELQDALLSNYEGIIKNISDAGGIVILDIFGTPAGLGKVLDKRSPPWDLKAFKELVKTQIKNLSYQKRYNIWYELWSAPDLDEFFLGRKQEYLSLYRAVAEAIKELEAETKIHIPLGGPGVSWWSQNLDGNTIITPERSLIYELIRFCAHYRLPLDFISWHTYSTDPKVEKDTTIYHKSGIALIRDWLTYFKFDRHIPLIVDEWNYDRQTNVLLERNKQSFISASYIPARLKQMYEADLDYQLYFSLEDFQGNKEEVTRNTGIFWFDSDSSEYKGGMKSVYNVFRMLSYLDKDLFLSSVKLKDEFTGLIASKSKDQISILIYNYIDPDIAINYLSKNIATLNGAERKFIINLVKSGRLDKLMLGELNISTLRVTKRTKNLLNKARELNAQAVKFKSFARNLKLGIKNLKDNHIYQRYLVDSSCASDCKFVATEEKEINATDLYLEALTLNPYSVNLIVLKPKPKEIVPEITTQNGNISARD